MTAPPVRPSPPRRTAPHPTAPGVVAALGLGALGATLSTPTLSAQQGPAPSSAPRPLTVQEVVDFRSLPTDVAPLLSPDGGRMAYVVEGPERTLGRVDELLDPASEAWTELRVVDLERGEIEVVARNAWAPAWAPDGDRLAYLVAEGDDIRLELSTWTGPRREKTRPDAPALWGTWMWTRPRWTPDGRHLVVKALPEGRSTREMLHRARPAPPEGDMESARLHPEASVDLFRSDAAAGGSGGSDANPDRGSDPEPPSSRGLRAWMKSAFGGDLTLIGPESGQVRRLTEGRTPILWRISPDRSSVAFLELEGVRSANVDFRLVTMPLDGGRATVRATRIRQAFGQGLSWSPDGSALAYLSGGDEEGRGLWVVDAADGAPRRVAELRPGQAAEVAPTWTSDGRALLVSAADTLWRIPVRPAGEVPGDPTALTARPGYTLGALITPRTTDHRVPADDGTVLLRVDEAKSGHPGFARVDARTGEITAIHTEPGAFGGASRTDLSSDGSAAVTWYSATRRAPELWCLGSELQRGQQVSRINPGFRPERLGRDRLVEWSMADGRTLQGTLLLPPPQDPSQIPSRPLPLVVSVYGGSSGAAAMGSFDRHRQLLASRGYAVLVPDIPLEVGTPMRDHAEAVLPAVDRLVDLGIADPARIGVTGHSYGGYGTLALLVQSDRFAAAVASAAQGDLVANYGRMASDGSGRMSWSEEGQGRMGGTLWEVPERYRENSPVWRLDQVSTPLLLLHGADDPTVPVWLAEAVFTELRRLHRPVALARYAGEGHWWGDWTRANQIDYWTRLVAWFDRYMGPEPAAPAPGQPL